MVQPMVHFAPGTHDWEDVSAVVSGAAPVASIDVTILFVGHSGQLWVDDVSVIEIRKGQNTRFLPFTVSSLRKRHLWRRSARFDFLVMARLSRSILAG